MNHEEFWRVVQERDRVHIIFLCAGNICRSPYLEMYFEARLRASHVVNKQKYIIQSGGFIHQRDVRIHPHTETALLDDGIPAERITRFESRTMRKHKEDMENADVLVSVNSNVRDVLVQARYRDRVILLSEMVDGQVIDIPDPALLTDYREYRAVMDDLKRLVDEIIRKMEELGL
jgi:protein-tyrosine-phosphatase